MATAALTSQPSVFARGETKARIRPAPKIALAEVNKNNLGTVRKLTSVLFPVVYSDAFYEAQLGEANRYCLLLYYNDIPVALLTSRIERTANSSEARLYIATLGVLAPYRRQGLAAHLLAEVAKRCEESWTAPLEEKPAAPQPAAPKKKANTSGKASAEPASLLPAKIVGCKVHVQTSNDGAKKFWEHEGFELTETLDKYYTRVQPASAWVLEKSVRLSYVQKTKLKAMQVVNREAAPQ